MTIYVLNLAYRRSVLRYLNVSKKIYRYFVESSSTNIRYVYSLPSMPIPISGTRNICSEARFSFCKDMDKPGIRSHDHCQAAPSTANINRTAPDARFLYSSNIFANHGQVRCYSVHVPPRGDPRNHTYRNRTTLNYAVAFAIIVLGFSYAAVPLYRVFCQVTGIGGASNLAKHGDEKVENLQKVTDRQLRIFFTADTASHLQWHFKPVQREVTVYPGETALAFYTAKNPTDRPIVGISTYTVLPYEAAKYLNKIQCFCFEEQRLNPHEQVDMPVFFYIDPEYVNDPWLQKADTVTLSYTFFEAKEGVKFLPQGQAIPHLRTTPGNTVAA